MIHKISIDPSTKVLLKEYSRIDGELVLRDSYTNSLSSTIVKLVVAANDPVMQDLGDDIAGVIAKLSLMQDTSIDMGDEGKITFSILGTSAPDSTAVH